MEAFKIKNGLSAKRYLGSTTTLSSSTIDLSLGSMFSTTLSSDPAYTFTNPPASGNAQAFSVEVTGGTTTFTQDSFATTLYTGNGTSQTITNGLDLANDGGLVWIKSRSAVSDHSLVDTVRGVGARISTNSSNAQDTYSGYLSAFNSNGFDIGYTVGTNNNGDNYASWTFKKQTKFFDIVTYTGDGVAGLTVNHSLGGTVGSMFVKCTSHADDWYVYHIETNATHSSFLNTTAAAAANGAYWNNTAPTTTAFTVGDNAGVNASGRTYVAYLFAHDTASDSRVKCGSYTGNGVADGPEINLGWSPEWILVKNTTTTGYGWIILDTVRGIAASPPTANVLFANNSNSEDPAGNRMHFTSNGFKITTSSFDYNKSGDNFIYMAIRGDAATDSAITWPSSVKWPAGVAPTTPAPGTKDLFTFLTTDGGTTYYGKKAAEGLA